MKNLIFTLIAIACVGLIAVGVINKNIKPASTPAPVNVVSEQADTSTMPDGSANATSTVAAVVVSPVTNQPVIKQDMKKYYPDSSSNIGATGSTGSTGTASASDQNFQITSSLMAQMHLVNKYNPGICFGAPAAQPKVAIDGMIASNPQLAQFIKQQYHLTTDLEVYNKMKQLQIHLVETQSGKFDFDFYDGQCSNVVYYQGTIIVVGSQVTDTLITQEAHSYQ